MTQSKKENNGETIEPKGPKRNKLTVKANLNFNVNLFKKWIKQKLMDDGKMFERETVDENKNKTGEKTMHLPNLNLAHVAMTAFNEKLCQCILEKAIERTQKGKGGLYSIKYQDVIDIIKIDPELRRNLFVHLDVYDNTLNYKDQYCIDEKCIRNYIDKVFGEHIDISNDAFNLLNYLLLKSCVRVLDTAFIMIVFAKRRSLNSNVILSSVDVHFCGTLLHLLKMRIEEAVSMCGKDNKEEEDAEKENEVVKEDEEENEIEVPEKKEEDAIEIVEEEPTIIKTEKKTTKQNKKK
jgi:hypothetical protein